MINFDNNFIFCGLYWDNPRFIENQNLCRSCIGFLIDPNLQISQKILDEINSIGFEKIVLNSWKAVEAEMEIIFKISYAIAPMKLVPKCYEFVKQNYKNYADISENDFPIYEIGFYYFFNGFDKLKILVIMIKYTIFYIKE